MYNERSINYNQQQPALTRIDERKPTVLGESRGTGRNQTAQKEHNYCARSEVPLAPFDEIIDQMIKRCDVC